MAEKLSIKIKKKFCEQAMEYIEAMEIYKDIMYGDSLITSFLIEVGCLKFRRCNHNDCPFRKNIPTPRDLKQYSKPKPSKTAENNLASAE